ncbi:MAG TPA: hypothetical protein VMB52_05020, partial [Verrucomicrobiae bacterium]|nr:hypothetical protein [Verrucomicrobiae bacterium]
MNPNEWFQPAVPHQPNTTQAPNATPQIQQPAPQMRNASVQGLPNTQPQYLVTPQGQVVVSANGVPQAPAYIQPVQGQPPAVASQLNAYISAETQPQIDEGPINTISLSANILFWLGIFLAAVLVLVCIVVITGQTSTSQKVSRLIITILDIVAASGMVVIGHRLKDL